MCLCVLFEMWSMVLQAVLVAAAERFIDDHPGPMLFSAQGDCTPTYVRFSIRVESQGVRTQRSGRSSEEFLMQKWFLYGFRGDCVEVTTLVREPYALQSTAAWHYFLGLKSMLSAKKTMRLERLTWHL